MLGVDLLINRSSWFELYRGKAAFQIDEPPFAFAPLGKGIESAPVSVETTRLMAATPTFPRGFAGDVKLLMESRRTAAKQAPAESRDPKMRTAEGLELQGKLRR